MIISNYSASNCAARSTCVIYRTRWQLAASHSAVIKRGVIRAVIDERPTKEAEKKCFVSARLRGGISIWLCICLIFKLFRERIEINRQRIPSPRSRYLRVPGRFKVIGEYAATTVRLSRFEPVHVIIDVAHPGDEFRVCHLQTREALNNSIAFTACQQRRDFLVLPHNRAHHWMRPDCKQN